MAEDLSKLPNEWRFDGVWCTDLPPIVGNVATFTLPAGKTIECTFYNSFGVPTAVTLALFNAAAQDGQVAVTWETTSEFSNLGFNLYRSTAQEQQGELMAFVPAQTPGSGESASYVWQDADVSPGNTYFYRLEDVGLNGTRTLHGPVGVTYRTGQSPSGTDGGASARPDRSTGNQRTAVGRRPDPGAGRLGVHLAPAPLSRRR